jgi:hypothetical protein
LQSPATKKINRLRGLEAHQKTPINSEQQNGGLWFRVWPILLLCSVAQIEERAVGACPACRIARGRRGICAAKVRKLSGTCYLPAFSKELSNLKRATSPVLVQRPFLFFVGSVLWGDFEAGAVATMTAGIAVFAFWILSSSTSQLSNRRRSITATSQSTPTSGSAHPLAARSSRTSSWTSLCCLML